MPFLILALELYSGPQIAQAGQERPRNPEWQLRCEILLGASPRELQRLLRFDQDRVHQGTIKRLLRAVDESHSRHPDESLIEFTNLYLTFVELTGYDGTELLSPSFINDLVSGWPQDPMGQLVERLLSVSAVQISNRFKEDSVRARQRLGRLWLQRIREIAHEQGFYFVSGEIWTRLVPPAELGLNAEQAEGLEGGSSPLLTEKKLSSLYRLNNHLLEIGHEHQDFAKLLRFAADSTTAPGVNRFVVRDAVGAYMDFLASCFRFRTHLAFSAIFSPSLSRTEEEIFPLRSLPLLALLSRSTPDQAQALTQILDDAVLLLRKETPESSLELGLSPRAALVISQKKALEGSYSKELPDLTRLGR